MFFILFLEFIYIIKMMKLLMMAIYILILTNLSFAICPDSNPGIRCIWYYDSCTSDLMCFINLKILIEIK